MELTKKEWMPALFTLGYIVAFGIYYLAISNFEFLWYIAVLLFFFALIALTQRRAQFGYMLLWALSAWGLLHMAGGGVVVAGDVLYRLPLLHLIGEGESLILKFDQAVHFYGFAVATYVVYHLLKPYLNERTNWSVVYAILVAAGIGLGAVNEIIEFAAFVAFAETGVGGYINTSLDLVFNTLGAIAAVVFISVLRKRTENI